MIPDQRIKYKKNIVEIESCKIRRILFVKEHQLKDGGTIIMEQDDPENIKKGDVIISSSPISPLPNGKYKINGKWRKVEIRNMIVQ